MSTVAFNFQNNYMDRKAVQKDVYADNLVALYDRYINAGCEHDDAVKYATFCGRDTTMAYVKPSEVFYKIADYEQRLENNKASPTPKFELLEIAKTYYQGKENTKFILENLLADRKNKSSFG